jgi:CIC family chloride channel protein
MYSHIITSALTVGFGGSAGLESPIVSTGSAIGSNFSKRYKLNYKDRTMLLAAGAAGGISAAFNSPIAGVLFALEVVLVDVSITAFIPLLIAAASGALLSKIILNENELLLFRLQQPFNYHFLPLYIILGVLAGFVSYYYIVVFDAVETKFNIIKSKYLRWLIGGLILAVLIAFFPSLFGEGYRSIKSLSELKPELLFKESVISPYINNPWTVLLFISTALLLKAFAAGITLGSGGNGGNFAPSLFVGAYLGFIFSYFLKLLGFDQIPIANFTIVAMAGILSGVFHAPLTAIFLIAEITGGYELIIPLMLVSSISYIIMKRFHPVSLDVWKLKERGTIVSTDKDTNILVKIDIRSIIENDFSIISPDDKLRSIVEAVKYSKRNTFPVVNKQNKIIGVILFDNLREEMFNQELYDKVIAKELMNEVTTKIDSTEDVFSIMKKFEETDYYNIPVIENDQYIGFISRSAILTAYRNTLMASI